MFHRAILLWLVSLLLPVAAASQNSGIKQGDPAFYFDFPGGTISLISGETWCEHLLQDTLYYVGQGQSAAYIPFELCNGDPCAPPTDYALIITNSDASDPIEQADTTYGVNSGECVDVYAIVDAGMKPISYTDTLTIIAWDLESGTVYDTCVQAWYVYESLHGAPVMDGPVFGIMVVILLAISVFAIRCRMM